MTILASSIIAEGTDRSRASGSMMKANLHDVVLRAAEGEHEQSKGVGPAAEGKDLPCAAPADVRLNLRTYRGRIGS